ncbi:MG284/MPN403 family protein [Metamycoplasma neophronis]|uniref:Uncharacterized protein n=1 Tax=Metamycoplasma neophronis TaxID=872983 RepID=A0ABY2Z108_9BACT|nr:hypothetical protein [Metamycoplasma neophronis]TPR54097.1 hypothetical protein FJR74_01490 [Metamycoplasma neophronis]
MNDDAYKKIQKLCLQQKKEFIYKFCLYEKVSINAKKMKNNHLSCGALDVFLASLNDEDKLIFTQNFIAKNNDPDWYLDHWSKNAYYKKLHFIVNLFLRFLNAYNS